MGYVTENALVLSYRIRAILAEADEQTQGQALAEIAKDSGFEDLFNHTVSVKETETVDEIDEVTVKNPGKNRRLDYPKILKRLKRGDSKKAIAREMDCSPAAIYYVAKNYGQAA